MNKLKEIYDSLLQGNINLAYINKQLMNHMAVELLEKTDLSNDDVEQLRLLLLIGNVTYNNMDTDYLPIEDGVYDLLIEKYRRYTKDDIYPVGAPPVSFNSTIPVISREDEKPLMIKISDTDIQYKSSMLFPELTNIGEIRKEAYEPSYILEVTDKMTKRTRSISHSHPDLVGTFDKCKFVLNNQAYESGVLEDSSVRVLERDFFEPLLRRGVIDSNTQLTIIAELKYDGMSVEADVSNRVISARTRGDAELGEASDVTPIFEGYEFRNNIDEVMGMKFEAIITYPNLARLNNEYGLKYVNSRTAISGICDNSTGRKYRDFITLVPLATDRKIDGKPIDRIVELEFLNRYYAKDVPMKYSIFTGNYVSILYQMKRYVEEAEFSRSYLPFMYDGVVFEFYDDTIRTMLGRDHSIDRYKVAVKFNPMKKQTTFRYYDYTIGQDGSITPMIHYDAIEFIGTVHTKSTGHSYERFKQLDLHVGDIIDVEYRHDVMPYVTKPTNNFNIENSKNDYNELDTFPIYCPCCGAPLTISESGKSVFCPNISCSEREIKRMTSTLDKLGIEDFRESAVRTLNLVHLSDYLKINDENAFAILGESNKTRLMSQLIKLKQNPIQDYKAIGSLGFNNIASKTWMLIFRVMTLSELLHYYYSYNGDMTNITVQLNSIKGIGKKTINTIIEEFPYFAEDIRCVCEYMQIIDSKNASRISKKQIRFTGCRDKQLEEQLSNLGYDIDGNASVTKATDILLIPYNGYTQGNKYDKAVRYGIEIITLEEFKKNMVQFL